MLFLPACLGADPDTAPGPGGGGKADDPEEGSTPAAGLGTGDHSPSSVKLHIVVKATRLNAPTAMAFPPDAPDDLWIVNEADDSWTIVDDLGGSHQRTRRYYDDSDHFLNNPTSIAFGAASEHVVATCQESLNEYNGMAVPDGFMGPVAWTTVRSRFSGGTASHYDMAHESPLCMGIAWERDHVWWTFNGYDSSLDRIDFHGWHPDTIDGLGGHDHTDGTYQRYALGEVRRVETVPSHMAIDPANGLLYVADTGNHRIVRLDTSLEPTCQPYLGRFGEMSIEKCDTELEVVVTPDVELEAPSGLVLAGGILYVSDHATGILYAFTPGGSLLNWLDTGRGANAITGLAVSPEGVVYFLDTKAERLYRIEPLAG